MPFTWDMTKIPGEMFFLEPGCRETYTLLYLIAQAQMAGLHMIHCCATSLVRPGDFG